MQSVTSEVFKGEEMHLNAVQVSKPDGRVFCYYVLPSLKWWELRKIKIRNEAFKRIRDFNEPKNGTKYKSFVEYTNKRGWKECPR